jgi:hypothetical protein
MTVWRPVAHVCRANQTRIGSSNPSLSCIQHIHITLVATQTAQQTLTGSEQQCQPFQTMIHAFECTLRCHLSHQEHLRIALTWWRWNCTRVFEKLERMRFAAARHCEKSIWCKVFVLLDRMHSMDAHPSCKSTFRRVLETVAGLHLWSVPRWR